jgi:hypothetical protein
MTARFSLVKLGQLLMQAADRGIGSLLSHFPALRGAFQVERTVVFDAHDPFPARRRCRSAAS